MKRLLFAPLLILLFCSCRKNDVIVAHVDGPRLARIKAADGSVRTEFNYDELGRIENQKNYSLRKTPDEINYAYDRQGRLAIVETTTLGHLSCAACEGPALQFTQTFEYNAAGQVARTMHRQEDGTLTNQWAHEYDGNGRLVRRSSTTRSGANGNYVTYAYDSRGNITNVETFAADGRLTNRETYEYDERPNPFQRVYLGLYAALFLSPNNVVRSKSEFLSPGGAPPSEGSKRYTYDPTTGYPVRVEHENGSVSIYEYQ